MALAASVHTTLSRLQLPGLMREWLGDRIGICAAVIDGTHALLPEEQTYVERAVMKRCSEFSTGRYCARRALHSIGIPAQVVPVGQLREPVWPDGIVGSISHDGGICIAIVTRRIDCQQVGVDLICTPSHARLLDDRNVGLWAQDTLRYRFDGRGGLVNLLVPFSIMESAVKVLSPCVRRFVDPREVHLNIGQASFTASTETFSHAIRGWWCEKEGFIISAARLAM